MNHLGTVTIETERLILRRFREEDSEKAYANWMRDEAVTKYLRWPPHPSVEVSRSIIKEWVKAYDEEDFYQWVIEVKAIQEPIGTISVVRQNERVGSMDIGYCIGSKWWHQGIVTEAFKAIIKFLFEEVKVNRIEALHDTNNPNSGKVMRKCGLTYEGTLRQADFNNQGIVDTCIYGIVASDYNKNEHPH